MENVKDIHGLLDTALAVGFSRATHLPGLKLECEPRLRAYCNPEGCPKHGNNWVCPPGCGSLEECAEKAARFDKGILLQSVTATAPDTSPEEYSRLSREHNLRLREFIEAAGLNDILALTTGGCILCEKCSYPEPCLKPDIRMNSLSAYGIDAGKLCERAGWDYSFRPDKLFLTALVMIG